MKTPNSSHAKFIQIAVTSRGTEDSFWPCLFALDEEGNVFVWVDDEGWVDVDLTEVK